MEKKTMFVALGAMVAVAAAIEFLIVHYRNPICEFVSSSPHVFALRVALIVTGGVIVAASSIVGIKRGRRIPDRESDNVALRCFAVAMLLIPVPSWTLSFIGLDASFFSSAASSSLVMFGSVVAIRNKRWGWIIAYLLIFLFWGGLYPPQ